MKDKLINAIREVPIADKTYTQYVEAVADRVLVEIENIFKDIESNSRITFINGNEDNPMLIVDYEAYIKSKIKYGGADNGQRKAD